MIRDRDRCDVLVVGARCAGAATALLLARAGLDVLLVDRAPAIGDTLSTHALMRPGVAMLDALGVLPRLVAAGTPAVTRARFAYGAERRLDVPVKARGGAPGLLAPRRHLLDRALCDAGVAAGARLSLGTSFEEVRRDRTGRVVGAELCRADGTAAAVRADLVVGADGRTSRVAQAVAARTLRRDPRSIAVVYGYFGDIPNEGYRWYFAPGVQVGLIPTTGGRHCVFAACRPPDVEARFGRDPLAGIAGALAPWEPEIAAGLLRAGPVERLRRFAGAPGHLRDCAGPGWALVGDAGHYKDPATAHGITDALVDAARLAVAQASRALADYRERRDAGAVPIFEITQRIASLDWELDELEALHVAFNDEMRRELAEVEAMLPPATAPSGRTAGEAGRCRTGAALFAG